jgi:peptidoglycan/xylan/chitin deacetylase (PgdA/CDA1 family)
LDNVPRGLRQALLQEGVPVRERQPGPPEGRFILFDSRTGRCRPPSIGQSAIDVDPLRRGWEEDPFKALVDQRAARFQWEIAGLELSEEIARTDKQTVRRKLLDQLREKIEQCGGIWVRVAAFPFPYHSALNFRLDYDHYNPEDFQTTLDAIADIEPATSHYVCGSAYQSAPEALARLRGLDVGSHGYRHHTYRTVEENLRNISRGIDVLRSAGIDPRGFVAPHGRFNRGLLVALETLGIPYSSEFALAYDDLPFLVGSSDVLQIPIHPVCLELFAEAARRTAQGGAAAVSMETAVRAAAEYFQQLAQIKYRSGEPVFFYGHPTGRAGGLTRVLPQLAQTVAGFGAIWKTTLSQFNDWWRARAEVSFHVTTRFDEYIMTLDRPLPGYPVGIEYLRGKHLALIPLDRQVVQFSPGALAYETRLPPPPTRAVRVDRPEGFRGRVRRMIDWEYVTPVEEIATGTWRNWAKRTLRRWWKP